MKKKLNVDAIANELKGGSAFFPGYRKAGSDIGDEETTPIQKDEPPSRQNASIPANQHAVFPDFQHASKPASQISSKPANRRSVKPSEKVTYRFHPEGKYAIED